MRCVNRCFSPVACGGFGYCRDLNTDEIQLRNRLSHMHGLYVGQLDEEESRIFRMAVANGFAYSTYDGAGGFLGLAKVRVL